MTRVAVIASRIRVEEKLLLAALETAGAEVVVVNDDALAMPVERAVPPQLAHADVVLERSLSAARGIYILRLLQAAGIPTVNRYDTAATCWDKLLTSAALAQWDVPQPRTRVAFSEESALAAIDELGYPVVLKPVVGSWGRLLAPSPAATSARS